MKKIVLISILILTLACTGGNNVEEGLPQWILDAIEIIEDPNYTGNFMCTDHIWQYDFQGDRVYYFNAGRCMDAPEYLFDENGQALGYCGGWGPCDSVFVEFYEHRTNGECIWQR